MATLLDVGSSFPKYPDLGDPTFKVFPSSAAAFYRNLVPPKQQLNLLVNLVQNPFLMFRRLQGRNLSSFKTQIPILEKRGFSTSHRRTMLHHLMVGTWTPPGAIFTFQFDDEALTLKMIKRTEIPKDEPISWMTFDVRQGELRTALTWRL